MKYIILVSLAFSVLVNPALAHPPSNATASYDSQSQVLTVVVSHNTFAPAVHYVKKVSLSNNGKEFLTQNFSSQYDKQRQVVMAVIPGLKGSFKVTVKADCSLWGTLEKELTVEINDK